MNIDVKTLNEILANPVQQHIERCMYHDHESSVAEMQGWFYRQKSFDVTMTLIEGKNTQLSQLMQKKAFDNTQYLFMIQKNTQQTRSRRK